MTEISSRDIIQRAQERYSAGQGCSYPHFTLDDGDKILVEEIARAVNAALGELAAPEPAHALDNTIHERRCPPEEIKARLAAYERIARFLGFEPSSTGAVVDAVIADRESSEGRGTALAKISGVLGDLRENHSLVTAPHDAVEFVTALCGWWEAQRKTIQNVNARGGALNAEKFRAENACAQLGERNKLLAQNADVMRISITRLQNDLVLARANLEYSEAARDSAVRQRDLLSTKVSELKAQAEAARKALR